MFGRLWLVLILFSASVVAQQTARVEMDYRGGRIVITANRFQTLRGNVLSAQGNVVVTYSDATLTADEMKYDQPAGLLVIDGQFELKRGPQWLKGTGAEIQVETDTGVIFNAEGYTDSELYVQAETLTKTGPNTYVAENGYLTACEDFVPKWSFTVSRATVRTGGTARLVHTLFKVKKIPLLYFPYLIFPTGEKERSSGFLLPTTGNSNNKGRRISQSFYLVLGRSADLVLREDYFSKRGFGHGFSFRTRPNQITYLEFDAYVVDDRFDQGGSSINGVGETRFGDGFRAVADFNLVSNFVFRQVFSDNFFTATRPTERSRFFLTNSFQSRSFNALISKEETVFPRRNVITRATPTLQFRLHGQRLLQSPFYLDLDAAAGGLSRSDRFIETPRISQRIDFFPQLYFSVPLFQGLQLTPTIGLRQTFYSDSLLDTPDGTVVVGDDVNRRYADISVELKGWGLSKVFRTASGKTWKHLIEPVIQYRYVGGIDDFKRTLRFDEVDAVADTNELEYGIFNRFFVKKPDGSPHEWLSVKVAQKYFFDDSFGGVLEEGKINQFSPLNSLTGFPFATAERDFAPITTLVRWSPRARYSFDLRGDYDVDEGRFRNFSVTGFLNVADVSLSTSYFVADDLVESTGKSNQIQSRVAVGNFQRGLSVASSFSYDIRDQRMLNQRSRLNYFWDCCGVSIEFQRFNVGLRQESQFRFSFFLKGIGAFGTIKRPDNIF